MTPPGAEACCSRFLLRRARLMTSSHSKANFTVDAVVQLGYNGSWFDSYSPSAISNNAGYGGEKVSIWNVGAARPYTDREVMVCCRTSIYMLTPPPKWHLFLPQTCLRTTTISNSVLVARTSVLIESDQGCQPGTDEVNLIAESHRATQLTHERRH